MVRWDKVAEKFSMRARRLRCSTSAALAAGALLWVPACSTVTPQPYKCASPAEARGLLKIDPDKVVPGVYTVRLKDEDPEQAKRARAAGVSAEAQLRSETARLSTAYGLKGTRPFRLSRAFTARTDVNTASSLADDPRVQYVAPAQRIAVEKPSQVSMKVATPTGIDRMNARSGLDGDGFPYGGTCEGVTVVDVDTGVDCEHPEFLRDDGTTRCGPGYSTLGDDPWYDGNGHGTHTASTAAGRNVGVCRGAEILPYKFLTAQGSGTDADAAEALDHASARCKDEDRKCVFNNSWGGQKSVPVDEAFCNAVQAGNVLLAAAGNENLNACDYSPARVDLAITVGASDPRTDSAAPFSNTGSCIDVYAPGVDILGASPGGGYAELSGTSMACPGALGVAGQCLEDGEAADDVPACVAERATRDVLSGVVDAPNLLVYDGAVK